MSNAVAPDPRAAETEYREAVVGVELPAVTMPPLPVQVTESVPVEARAARAFTAYTYNVPATGTQASVIAPRDATRRRLVVQNTGSVPVVIADTDSGAAQGLGFTLPAGSSLVMLTWAAVHAAGVGGASTVSVLAELAPAS